MWRSSLRRLGVPDPVGYVLYNRCPPGRWLARCDRENAIECRPFAVIVHSVEVRDQEVDQPLTGGIEPVLADAPRDPTGEAVAEDLVVVVAAAVVHELSIRDRPQCVTALARSFI